MPSNAEARLAYVEDGLMCDNVACPIRSSCQRHHDWEKAGVALRVERSRTINNPDMPDVDDDGVCFKWVLLDSLDTDLPRDRANQHRQFSPRTKRWRRRGGDWA